MLSSEIIISLLTPVTRQHKKIIYLHSSPPCSNQHIRKKRLAVIQQSELMKGTFVRWFISKCKSLRDKHQMEMNQTMPLWEESNFPWLAVGTLLRSLSPSSSQAWTHQHCGEGAISPLD